MAADEICGALPDERSSNMTLESRLAAAGRYNDHRMEQAPQMKKRVPNEVPTSASPDMPKKTVPIDKVFAESTVKSGSIIMSGEHVAKMWEASRKAGK